LDAARNVLVCDGDGGHDMLLTRKEYADAVFHFECRYGKVEEQTGYNSGAYVRNSKDGAFWHQAQFGDAQDGYLFGETRTADGGKKFFQHERRGEGEPRQTGRRVEHAGSDRLRAYPHALGERGGDLPVPEIAAYPGDISASKGGLSDRVQEPESQAAASRRGRRKRSIKQLLEARGRYRDRGLRVGKSAKFYTESLGMTEVKVFP